VAQQAGVAKNVAGDALNSAGMGAGVGLGGSQHKDTDIHG